MAVEPKPVPPATPSAPDGGTGRTPRGGAARQFVTRALTLRESSIVVVTLVTFAYFAITNNSSYLTAGNWKALLPYFTFLAIMAAGEVFVMTLGEIDLSVGAMYLVTPLVVWKLDTAGIA